MADAEPAELRGHGDARRPRRPSSNAARSRRSPVSTRSVRPVSGSIRVSSPTSTSGSSRGSTTSMARTVWRPATSVSGATPVERAAEVGDDDDDARGLVRDAATSASARAGGRRRRRPPRAVRWRGRRSRPSIPLPATGRRASRVSRPAPKVDDAEPVASGGRRTGRRRARRPRPRRPCAGRRSRSASTAEWSSRSHAVSWRSGTSSRTCGTSAAGGGVPVDAPDVVARLVRPDAVEVQPVPEAAAAVVAGHPAADAAGRGATSSWRTRSSAIGPGPGRAGRPRPDRPTRARSAVTRRSVAAGRHTSARSRGAAPGRARGPARRPCRRDRRRPGPRSSDEPVAQDVRARARRRRTGGRSGGRGGGPGRGRRGSRLIEPRGLAP